MPKPKTSEGVTDVLEPKARGLSINETLALACNLEDIADALARFALCLRDVEDAVPEGHEVKTIAELAQKLAAVLTALTEGHEVKTNAELAVKVAEALKALPAQGTK